MTARALNRSAKRGSARRPDPSVSIKAGKNAEDRKTLRPVVASDKGTATAKKAAVKTTRRRPKDGMAGKSATLYLQSAGWEIVDVVDGIALYDDKFKTVHYLNHTAAMVFLLCKRPVGLDVLSAVFQEEFSLKTAPKAELRKLLGEMQKTGLLRVAEPENAKAARVRPVRKT